MINKRLLSVDMLRGFAIVAILVIHRIHYQWTGMETREILHTHIAGIWAPFIILTIILFTMAGIFYFLTGVVNAYSIFNRYSRDTCSKSRWMWGGIIGGLWLIMLNYFHRMFLVNGFVAKADGTEPEFPVGLLTGWARSGSDVVFRWSQITEPGTLSLIGMILIIITLTFGILFKNENHKHIFRINFILTVLAVIFLAASPFMKYWLRPEYEYAYQHGHYFYAACLGHVSQEFCLFPNLGYGFAGAIIGLALARKEDPKRMRRRNLIWALFLFIIGLTGVFLFDKHDEFGKRVIGACVSYVELGIFILMFNGLLKMYDFAKEEKKLKRWNRSLGIRRFGMVALTVYFFEPLVAELLKKVIDLASGTTAWTNQFPLVLAFGLFCLVIWWIILYYWAKINFAGSLEWVSGWLLLHLAGKRSTKTEFASLHDPVPEPVKQLQSIDIL